MTLASSAPASEYDVPPMFKIYPALASTFVAGCLSGCGSAALEAPAPPPVDARFYQPTAARLASPTKSPTERERENAEAFGRALGEGDTKALTALLDPDVDFSFPGMAGATERNGTLQAITDLFGAFTERKYAPTRVWQIGEAAVVEWTMIGTQSGPWMGVAATAKPVAIRGASLLWFNLNGLIGEVHVYFDCGAVLAELGAAPNPAIQTGPTPLLAPSATVTLAGGTPEEKANVAIVNSSWDALEAKKEAGYLAAFAEDVEFTRFDRTSADHGKDERRKFFRWVTTGLSSLAQTPMNAWGAGDFVIEEYTINGVHSGKLTSGPPSGHAIRLDYLDVYEMHNGKITRAWTYGNSLQVYAQAGVIPTASPGPSAVFAPPPAMKARP
jgi:ketosteroid isomerase-like protein